MCTCLLEAFADASHNELRYLFVILTVLAWNVKNLLSKPIDYMKY